MAFCGHGFNSGMQRGLDTFLIAGFFFSIAISILFYYINQNGYLVDIAQFMSYGCN